MIPEVMDKLVMYRLLPELEARFDRIERKLNLALGLMALVVLAPAITRLLVGP